MDCCSARLRVRWYSGNIGLHEGADKDFSAYFMNTDIFAGVVYVNRHSKGYGQPVLDLSVSDVNKTEKEFIALSHKTADDVQSIAELAARIPKETLRVWAGQNNSAIDLQNHFSGKVFLVNDASADTCIALAVLCLRLIGRDFDAEWLRYASHWERGETALTGSAYKSFGARLTALTHAEYHGWQSGSDAYDAYTAKALDIGLRFTLALMDKDISPFDCTLTDEASWDENLRSLYLSSTNRLRYEEMIYNQIIDTCSQVQLAVDLSGTRKKTLVDCVILSDATNISSMKNFTRSDSRSFLGTGFGMQALFRSSEGHRGLGSDFTISLDPQHGASLWRLWQELELNEDAAWAAFAKTEVGFERPRAKVPEENRDLVSYQDENCLIAPSIEPWWDGGSDHTLLGAPRQVLHEGKLYPASLLGWNDVKRAIWRCYAPTLGLRVRPRGSKTGVFKITESTSLGPDFRRLINAQTDIYICDLERCETQRDHSGIWTPTLLAALADFAERGDTSIDSLPTREDFDLLQEKDGIVIVTAHGLLLLDLSKGERFPAGDLRETASEVAMKVQAAQTLETFFADSLRAQVRDAISDESNKKKRNALKAIYSARLSAQEKVDKSRNHESNDFIRRFKSLCEQRWQASSRYDEALSELGQLEAMLISSSEVRANMLLNKLAVYGLPLSLAGNLLGGLIVLSGATFLGVAWPIVLTYFGLSAGGIALLMFMQSSQRRLWKLRK